MNPAKISYDPNKHTIYKPINKEKYVDSAPIICKSSWESSFCQWCDMNPSIIQWCSEGIAIKYEDPVKRKSRRYYPDFILKIRNGEGKETIHIVEIKPEKEIRPPVKGKRKSEKTLIHETTTWMTNQAKWRAANLYCKKRNIVFHIITEKELFNLK